MGAHRARVGRMAGVVAATGALAAGGCASADAATVVRSACNPDGSYEFVETVPSSVDPTHAWPGGTVTFEVEVSRLQFDIGPVRQATYTFPIPDGVDQVTAVTFADENPNTWSVEGETLVIGFRAPEGDFLVNDFPRVTVQTKLRRDLPSGASVTLRPYVRFTQEFVNVTPLECVRVAPDVLQRVRVL